MRGRARRFVFLPALLSLLVATLAIVAAPAAHGDSSGPPPTTTTVSTTTTTATTTTTTTTVPTTTTTTLPYLAPVSIDQSQLDFGQQRVGTYGQGQLVTFTNPNDVAIAVTRLGLSGRNSFDFFGASDCLNHGHSQMLAAGASCRAVLYFNPLQPGNRSALLVVVSAGNSGNVAQSVVLSGAGTEGYFLAGAKGEIANFGDAVFHGDAFSVHLKAPIISLATTPNGAGYWLLGRDGGIFGYGNARFFGSTGNIRLNKPIVAMSASPDGKGYRLVGSDGGIFGFGSAHFYGSTGSMHLNKPIVGMASTPDGRGYWLVASDGGIFGFGNAHFYGSAVSRHPNTRVIQITPTPSGRGYWIFTANGQLFPFGDAHSYGTYYPSAMAGMAPAPDGRGYWEATRTGAIFKFGRATYYGDIRTLGVNDVIGIAATAPPLPAALLPAATAAGRTSTTPRGSWTQLGGGGVAPTPQHTLTSEGR